MKKLIVALAAVAAFSAHADESAPLDWIANFGEIAKFCGKVLGHVYGLRVFRFFGETLRQAEWRAELPGIAKDKILIDPGFGFGKNVGHNLELMNGLALFHSLGCPLVLGASRKRIGPTPDRSAPGRARTVRRNSNRRQPRHRFRPHRVRGPGRRSPPGA